MNGKAKWFVLMTLLAVLLLAAVTARAGSPAQDPHSPDPTDAQAASAAPTAPLGTTFTYQGKLEDSSGPISATCQITFRLYDQASGGVQVGSALTQTVSIDNGLFTVELDFGASAFDGEGRWLGVQVSCPGDSGFTDLGRQELTAAPYALYALKAPWSGMAGVPAGFADGVDDNTTYSAGTGLSLSGTTFNADTTYLQRRVSGTCSAGNAIRVVNADGTVTCQPVTGGTSWLLSGNAGTTPGTHFLGTTDAISLTLAVSGTAALRLEPSEGAPNLIGGYSGNNVTGGAYGTTIGGGGASGNTNRVTDDFGTVGGGANNRAGDDAGTTSDALYTTVGGGWGNTASGSYATLGGGFYNDADGDHSTVGGGYLNDADSTYATVGGGASNDVSGHSATIGGGFGNEASDYYATIGGGYDNTANDWSATVGGGYSNEAGNYYTTVGGGYGNTAGDYAATVGGGHGNNASASYATIAGGGRSNPGNPATGNRVTDNYGTVSGGGGNQAGDDAGTTNDATYATVGGGYNNTASGPYTTIGGGFGNDADGSHATIGGGYLNDAGGEYVTISGGASNIADGSHATVGGGVINTANAAYAIVGGGQSNTASGNYATVGGGGYNTASGLAAVVAGGGGYSSGAITNTASGNWSTIGGGAWNTASGAGSTIPGGNTCTAQGTNSFAAGTHAKANHQGTFVWSDHVYTDFSSERDNQFRIRARGGARFDVNSSGWVNIWDDGTNLINTSTGARLTVGGAWTNSSDRDVKENFATVDPQQVLASLASMPIQSWNYKAEDAGIRHMGPVAQDFYATFGLGGDDTSIATVDADGVALAAIQGLYEQNVSLQAKSVALEQENASLQAQMDVLQQQNADFEARLAALEQNDTPGAMQSSLPLGAWLLLGGLALAVGAAAHRQLYPEWYRRAAGRRGTGRRRPHAGQRRGGGERRSLRLPATSNGTCTTGAGASNPRQVGSRSPLLLPEGKVNGYPSY